MTDQPTPDDPHAAEPPPKKGKGCFYGGLATVGAFIGGNIIAGLIIAGLAVVFTEEGSLDEIGSSIGLLVSIIPLGLLIAAGFYWRKTPGFLLGIGLTIAISAAVLTGCFALIYSAGA